MDDPEQPAKPEPQKGRDAAGDAEVVQPEGTSPAAETGALVLARHVFPSQLPVIPLSSRPLFPKMVVPMVFEDDALKKLLVQTAKSSSKFVGMVLRRTDDENDAAKDQYAGLFSLGVIAEIVQIAQLPPDGPIQVLFSVLERFRIEAVIQVKPYVIVKPGYIIETEMAANPELKAYALSVITSIKELIQLNSLHKEELGLLMSQANMGDPGRLADFAAAMTTADGRELQDVLETTSIRARLKRTLYLLKKEIDISRIQVRIGKQIEEKLTKQQREFFLREQLKAIKKELGLEKEGKEAEIDRFLERLKKLKPSPEAQERIQEELDKLRLIEPVSPEFTVSRTYLDWLTILPWGVFTKDSYDIKRAERILNRDHYGLDDVKQRILEFLSVGILKGNIAGSILCFVGPPGVGKTSIGQSIAHSIGRNFYRFSVGGIRDEAEIKGHRRTYIGALPGKFIQAMKVCKSANPVIMLDEIDKIGASYQGDPASALLEVLDPEQNRDFLDHYLDVRFDLSNVFFICTANQLDTIPRPLLDRMEVINLAGYILEEKLEIARRYLVPRQTHSHGIKKGQVKITTPALRDIVDGYAREPGVRGLEKHIKRILRKTARKIVDGSVQQARIDRKDIPDLLGKRIHTDENYFKKPRPGIVMGLAWTSMGGDTLFIEATRINTGKAEFKQTGQLGSVMVESSEIAYTFVRSYLNNNEAARKLFEQSVVHLHVPAGATPKDGPSAGITMASSLYSLALNIPIKRGFAMTGELTLTGKVMQIGGLKEKTIAAKRAKVANLVFPEANRSDFEELPEHVRRGLKPHFVSTFADVVKICF
jgi:ATP-dependent Lon protease